MTSRQLRWRLNIPAGFWIGASLLIFLYATLAYLGYRKMTEKTFRLPVAEKRIDSVEHRRAGSDVVEYYPVRRFTFYNEHRELPDSFAVYLHADVTSAEYETTAVGDTVVFYAEPFLTTCSTEKSTRVAGRTEAMIGVLFLIIGIAIGFSSTRKSQEEAVAPAPAEAIITAHSDSSPGLPRPASRPPARVKTHPIDTNYRKYSPDQQWYIDIYWEVIKHEIANPVIFRNDGEEILSFANLGFELSGHEFNGDVVTLYLDAYPDRERFIAVLDLNRRDGSITHARRKISIQTTFDTLGRDLVKFRNSS